MSEATYTPLSHTIITVGVGATVVVVVVVASVGMTTVPPFVLIFTSAHA